MKILLPPLLQVDVQENGNSIQQWLLPPAQIDASVSLRSKGKEPQYEIAAHGDTPAILLQTKATAPKGVWTHCIRIHGTDISSMTSLDLRKQKWILHPQLPPVYNQLSQYEENATHVRDSWRNSFTFKEEDPTQGIAGLRSPQIGAIHAVLSHWTVTNDIGTVVLPTGVGKTETMLSLLAVKGLNRLLIVVPTDALRAQIADKFVSFGVLRSPEFKIIADTAKYPVVGILNSRPKTPEEVEHFFRKCNVVITTMPLASQCEPAVIQKMAELTSCLFVDEAHHAAATKWRDFIETVRSSAYVVQFTATPFRNDDKPIGGKRIYSFPLKRAQDQGYFKPITFHPVIEFDPTKKDQAIADRAVEQLRTEKHLGHIIMARVAGVTRAEEVFKCYEKYTEFEPVQIHTGIKSKAERDGIRKKLLDGKSRIVVCVDMLGEGFDLPELKIAAFHDIRKSLAVTLQLAGRFTRTKAHLGNATFIANIAETEVKEELKRLYQHDSDWNALLPLMSEGASEGEVGLAEFIRGFQGPPDELTLQNVRPALSAVVYRTKCTEWNPENFEAGIPGIEKMDKVYHAINRDENTLVIVTAKWASVDWAQIDEIHNWDWNLYVLHWHPDTKLLFIHQSSNAGFFRDLAKAVAGDSEQIKGPDIFRCLAGIHRLKLQNVGVLEHLGRLIRYTMRAGSDVEPAISEAQRNKAIKANIFGLGYEYGQRASIGCSYRGRIWSYQTTDLLGLTKWCRAIGEKLLNTTLDPDDVLKGTLRPVLVAARPISMPIAVEWPEEVYNQPEQTYAFECKGTKQYLGNVELRLIRPAESGPLEFGIVCPEFTANFELVLSLKDGNPDYTIVAKDHAKAKILRRSAEQLLLSYFIEHPPTFWFADGSSLTGIEHVALPSLPVPFQRERIEAWDWNGTNIKCESQGIDRDPTSIQYRVIAEIRKRGPRVIFDDDDRGESADVVAIWEKTDTLEIEFWHCKYAMDVTPGKRIKELYELCGQAQKCIHWMQKPPDLFTHLMRREPRRLLGRSATRYEVGAVSDLMRLREKAGSQRLLLRVNIVQPGLSKAECSRDQLQLLAVTEDFLLGTREIPLGIVASD